MNIDIKIVQKLTSPNPFCIVTSKKPDGSTNAMALSWWTYVCNRPPMVCIALSKKGYSRELIQQTGEFALSFPGTEVAEAAFSCGTCSGRDNDKPTKFGLPMRPGEVVSHQVVDCARAVIECKAKEYMEAGDHCLIIGEVIATSHNERIQQLYAINGYAGLAGVHCDD